VSAKTIDLLVFNMILIVCEVILENEKQNDTNGNTQRETEDVEGRKELVLQKNPDRKFDLMHPKKLRIKNCELRIERRVNEFP
jgi:hypothetical protein